MDYEYRLYYLEGERMKKFVMLLMLASMVLMPITNVYGVKPLEKPGVEEYGWNLSGDIMAVPPYGLHDISGSDTASKLLVNQPNGVVEVSVTGVMSGLEPYTEYTVYISNGYTLNHERWNLVGEWAHTAYTDSGGGPYNHVWEITSQDYYGNLLGAGSGGGYTWTLTGTLVRDTVQMHIVYNNGYWADMTGTIAADGTISGTFIDSNNVSGTWYTTDGAATSDGSIGWGWSGLFNGLPTFTFTTDEYGHASWHFNLKDTDFPGAGTYMLSLWINRGYTILISDNFSVIV